MTNLITTADAARELGITIRRVQALIGDGTGRLRAQRVGQIWLIDPTSLDAVRERPPGRPVAKKSRRKRRNATN